MPILKLIKRITNLLSHRLDQLKAQIKFAIHSIFQKRAIPASNCLIISSETRGGSTWLMEMIASQGKFLTQWEPLHPNRGIVKKEFDLGDRPNFKKNNVNNDLINKLKTVFEGRYVNPWTIQRNSVKSILNYNRVLVKFVRANLLLEWIIDNIDLKYAPVVLIRHPIAVALSQLKAFQNAQSQKIDFKNYNVQTDERNYLLDLQDPLEIKVALWCKNVLPLMGSKVIKKTQIIFYEELLTKPSEVLPKVFKNWDIEFLHESLNNAFVRQESATAKDFDPDIHKQLNKWKAEISEERLRGCQKILDYYDCKIYNAFSPYPKLN